MSEDEIVEELVERWETLWHSGHEPSINSLCESHSHLIVRVSAQVEALRSMNHWLDIAPSTDRSADRNGETHDNDPSSDQQMVAKPFTTTSKYEWVRPHARGGLGEVFVARDSVIDREVAIKVIQPLLDRDSTRRKRFLREAEITGRLEHPGIVPVHGVGTDDSGRPCYSMRFVEGETLEQSIRSYYSALPSMVASQRNLALRQLLQRFISICNTIGYAHTQGYLHRDIKPSNIIVGKFGETIVVDWGLAKRIESSESSGDRDFDVDEDVATDKDGSESTEPLTQQGGVVGTPYYMSPEQADGRLGLTVQSDVYSLGATLYQMLCGTAPWADSTPIQALQRLISSQIRSPRVLNPVVPPALDAICMRAMALKPHDRYDSTMDLASDIERWLADEPVQAMRDSIIDRSMRWARRNRLWIATAGAASLVGIVSLAVLVGVMTQSNAALKVANEKEKTAKNDAVLQAHHAEESAKVADKQSSLSIAILQNVIENIQRDLRSLPSTQKIRREILLKSMQGLAEVSQGLEHRPILDRMTVLARRDLGDVYLSIGNDSGIGGTQAAYEQFQSALEIAERLAAELPYETQLRVDVASLYRRMASALAELKTVDQTEAYLDKHLALRKQIAEGDKSDFESQMALVSAFNLCGDHYMKSRSFDKASGHFENALALIQSLRELFGDPVLEQHEYVATMNNIGELRTRQGKHAEAIKMYVGSVEGNRKRYSASPNDHSVRKDLAFALSALGRAHWSNGEFKNVEPFYNEALVLRMLSAAEDPTNLSVERQVMQSHEGLGDLMLKLNRIDEAYEHFQSMHRFCSKHVVLNPESMSSLRDLSIALNRMAGILWERKEQSSALEYFQQGVQSDRSRATLDPNDPRARVDVGTSLSNLGTKYLELERFSEAIALLDESVKIFRTHYSSNHQDTKARRNYSVVLSQLGAAYRRSQNFDLSRECNSESIQLATDLAKASPSNAALQLDLVSAYHARGVLERSANDLSAARDWFGKALEVVSSLEKDNRLVGQDLEWRAYIEADLKKCIE